MTDEHPNAAPQISCEWGTAYDFFASLEVLHNPAKFGLRGAWAAGVRSRLGADERDFLEKYISIGIMPFAWIYGLPKPQDAATVLLTLRQTPPEERLDLLTIGQFSPDLPAVQGLRAVRARGSWTQDDHDMILTALRQMAKFDDDINVSPRQLEYALDAFAESEHYGEQFLDALQAYYDVFFAEEEKRIRPYLKQAYQQAQQLAAELSPLDLMEKLSRGLRYEEMPQTKQLVFVPSYWFSPLISWSRVSEDCMVWLYGARPAGESLVPGEIVPDDLLGSLKALADPTRLRILRYLMQEQLSPAELSRRLRLRAPTVTHHLHTLRLAGLVRFVMRGKNERLYFARMKSVKQTYAMLKDFLEEDVVEVEDIKAMDRRRAF